MPFIAKSVSPATIVAFGNLAQKRVDVSLREFAALAMPDKVWTSSRQLISEVLPSKVDVNWIAPVLVDRTEKYRLNAWLNFAPALYSARAEGVDTEYAISLKQFSGRWMAHWIRQHRFVPSDPTGGQLRNKLAWYDMAVGRRAALLSQVLADDGGRHFTREERKWLKRGVKDHVASLSAPETWAAHSNHGFFQSAGLFALATQAAGYVSRASKIRALAGERIRHYLAASFSEDGVHLEHSPEYHGLMFSALCELYPLLDERYPTEVKIRTYFESIQNAFEAMILPNHLISAFGDGRYTLASSAMPRGARVRAALNPDLHHALSADETDDAYSRFHVYQDGGFASYKRRSRHQTSYLGISSWHHSPVHKQIDDHTFIWAEDGAVILSDAGRYGYEGVTEDNSDLRAQGFFYSASERIFVESAHAHNTIEIDGKSDNRRNAMPYQSGLVAHGTVDDIFRVIELDIVREPLVSHKRILFYLPSDHLLVVDTMERLLEDGRGASENEFTSWHQYFPSWDVTLGDGQTNASFNPEWRERYFGSSKKLATARKIYEGMSPSAPYRVSSRTVVWTDQNGQQDVTSTVYRGEKGEDGRHLGWASLWPKTLAPSCAVGHNYTGDARKVSFATLFKVTRQDQPEQSVSDLKLECGEKGQHISWCIAGEGQSVTFEHMVDELKVSHNGADFVAMKRSIVQRNQSAREIYYARAAHQNGAMPDKIFAHYDNAIKTGDFECLKEASDYALSIGDEALSSYFLNQAGQNLSGKDMLELAKLHLGTKRPGVSAKETEALLLSAAQKNVRSAYFYLGTLYLDEERGLYSPKKALKAFNAGWNRGHLPCRKKIVEAHMKSGKHMQALSDLEEMWDHGDQGVGQLLLKYYMDKENLYGRRDSEKALSIHIILAEAGNKVSAYEAGRLAMQKDQVHYDLDLARKMFELAVEKGSAISAYYLSGLLDKTDLNYQQKARKLLEFAVAGNIQAAEEKLVALLNS